MTRNGRRLVCLAALGIGSVSFAAGRWAPPSSDPAAVERSALVSASSNTAPVKLEPAFETRDFSAVRIENLGALDFEQACVVLRGAPKETLAQWTMRLQGLPTSPHKAAGITAFFKTLSRIDTLLAVELAMSMDRREPRLTAIAAVARAAPAAHLSAVAEMYRSVRHEDLGRIEVVGAWSLTDPAAAAEFVTSSRSNSQNNEVSLVVSNWAALDPGAARKWLDSLDPGLRDENVLNSFYSGYLENDQTAALNDLINKPGDEKLKTAISSATGDLFVESPDAARAFITRLPPSAQNAALEEITSYVDGHNPRDEPVDTAAVAKWLLTLPDVTWSGHLGDVVTAWAEQDSAAYEGWLRQMSPQMQDRIAAEFCLSYDWYNPRPNLEAGLGITDQGLRVKTFHDLFSKMGPEKARALVEKAQLPAAQAASLEKIVSQL